MITTQQRTWYACHKKPLIISDPGFASYISTNLARSTRQVASWHDCSKQRPQSRVRSSHVENLDIFFSAASSMAATYVSPGVALSLANAEKLLAMSKGVNAFRNSTAQAWAKNSQYIRDCIWFQGSMKLTIQLKGRINTISTPIKLIFWPKCVNTTFFCWTRSMGNTVQVCWWSMCVDEACTCQKPGLVLSHTNDEYRYFACYIVFVFNKLSKLITTNIQTATLLFAAHVRGCKYDCFWFISDFYPGVNGRQERQTCWHKYILCVHMS